MIGVVLVSHSSLSTAFKNAVEHVVGAQSQFKDICIEADDNMEQRRNDIIDAVAEVDSGDGVIIVTDMFGGSPTNLSLRACSPENRRILYGANLPMLIKLAKSRHATVPDAVAAAIEAAHKYINSHNGGLPQ